MVCTVLLIVTQRLYRKHWLDFGGCSPIKANESFRKLMDDADLREGYIHYTVALSCVVWLFYFIYFVHSVPIGFICVSCEEGPPCESGLIGFECV